MLLRFKKVLMEFSADNRGASPLDIVLYALILLLTVTLVMALYQWLAVWLAEIWYWLLLIGSI